jgi:hypothetical protein
MGRTYIKATSCEIGGVVELLFVSRKIDWKIPTVIGEERSLFVGLRFWSGSCGD